MKKPSTEPKWLKVTVYFQPDLDLAREGLAIVNCFEMCFGIKNLYFSRYVDLVKNSIEISCLTDTKYKAIKAYFKSRRAVLAVAVEDRGSGSMAHVFAYQAVKRLAYHEKDDNAGWNEFLDVVHWMSNMNGYDYCREIRFYGYAAFCFANQLTAQSEANTAKLQGKAPAEKAARPASKCARQSKPAGSSRAAARKASGS